MAALSTTNSRPSAKTHTGDNPELKVYRLADTQVLFNMALTALYDGSSGAAKPKGTLGPWTNAADESFLGINRSETRTGTSLTTDPAEESQVQVDGGGLAGPEGVSVTASGSSLPGAPVYSATDNIDDLTVTPPTAQSKPVGELFRKKFPNDTASLLWEVILRTSQFKRQGENEVGPRVVITAAGTIASGTAANSDGKFHDITVGGTANIVVSTPTVVEIGNVCYLSRSAGVGVPTIVFANEIGTSLSRALINGETLKLRAMSATGWRPLS